MAERHPDLLLELRPSQIELDIEFTPGSVDEATDSFTKFLMARISRDEMCVREASAEIRQERCARTSQEHRAKSRFRGGNECGSE